MVLIICPVAELCMGLFAELFIGFSTGLFTLFSTGFSIELSIGAAGATVLSGSPAAFFGLDLFSFSFAVSFAALFAEEVIIVAAKSSTKMIMPYSNPLPKL